MTFSKLIQKRMFLIVIVILAFTVYFNGIRTGYNMTVGWAWDIRLWIICTVACSWLLYLIGYGVLAIMKIDTNKKYSIIHLSLILLIGIFDNIFKANAQLILLLCLMSLVIFFFNLIWSLKHRKKMKIDIK